MNKILLVEDEEGTRKLLRIIINWETYHMKIVAEASNGRQALNMIDEVDPDILITDIRMPIMDGIQLAREVREKYPQIKVVMITAYNEFSYIQEALRIGAVDFILKPLKREELCEAMERISQNFEHQDNIPLVERIKQYLEENYRNSELSIRNVADVYFINESYLSRIFKDSTGSAPLKYLNEIRMKKACELLTCTDKKVYQIAEETGFSNPDYFSKAFHKIMGVTVNEFLKSQKSTGFRKK
jgi:two-component system response regulator YesN